MEEYQYEAAYGSEFSAHDEHKHEPEYEHEEEERNYNCRLKLKELPGDLKEQIPVLPPLQVENLGRGGGGVVASEPVIEQETEGDEVGEVDELGALLPTGLIYSEELLEHKNPSRPHPERPARISQTYADLIRRGIVKQCESSGIIREASLQEILAVHSKRYLRKLGAITNSESAPDENRRSNGSGNESKISKKKRSKMINMVAAQEFESIYMNESSLHCAKLAAGGAIAAVDAVLSGKCQNSMALIRPPGHHAERDFAVGFCFFNNVAIAARYAQRQYGMKRILILDWDIHHGNGTQQIFYDDPNVLYISMHRWDHGNFFPQGDGGGPDKVGGGGGRGGVKKTPKRKGGLNNGDGSTDSSRTELELESESDESDDARGKNVNVAFNGSGVGDEGFLAVMEHIIEPMAYEFDPELIIVSAGYDACELGFNVTAECFAKLTRALKQFAHEKLVCVLEGGYELDKLSRGVVSTMSALAEDSTACSEFFDPKYHYYYYSMGSSDSSSEQLGHRFQSMVMTKRDTSTTLTTPTAPSETGHIPPSISQGAFSPPSMPGCSSASPSPLPRSTTTTTGTSTSTFTTSTSTSTTSTTSTAGGCGGGGGGDGDGDAGVTPTSSSGHPPFASSSSLFTLAGHNGGSVSETNVHGTAYYSSTGSSCNINIFPRDSVNQEQEHDGMTSESKDNANKDDRAMKEDDANNEGNKEETNKKIKKKENLLENENFSSSSDNFQFLATDEETSALASDNITAETYPDLAPDSEVTSSPKVALNSDLVDPEYAEDGINATTASTTSLSDVSCDLKKPSFPARYGTLSMSSTVGNIVCEAINATIAAHKDLWSCPLHPVKFDGHAIVKADDVHL